MHSALMQHTIITGSTIDYNKHCTLQFGMYVPVNEQHNNLLMLQTTGTIAHYLTGNAHDNFFLNLHSGKRIIQTNGHYCHASRINRDHTPTAAVCKKYEGVVFTDKDGIIIEDKNDPKDEILELQEWTNKILQSGHTTKYNKNVHTTENYRHGQTSK